VEEYEPSAAHEFPPVLRRFASLRYRVVDESMRPAFEPGDRLLVDRWRPRRGLPPRGAAVIVEDPDAAGRHLLKRVAGLPGDTVRRALDGEWRVLPAREPPGEAAFAYPVPPGHLFVLGDAPGAGRDSRRFGPVSIARLRGLPWYRYAPADRRGPLNG
jgi:signal peptidase I